MKPPLRIIAAALAVAIAATAVFAAIIHRPQAPDVRFVTLSGEELSTAALRGKVVVVNFWATTCAPCLREMPKLVEAHGKFAPRGYETVAVAMSYDSPTAVAAYTEQRALPFKIVLDTEGELAKRFDDVRFTPVSIVLDKQGRILKRYYGEPDWVRFYALIERALAEHT